nr:hypothetical protein KitaXyl93_16800 [Kitasatospora sp. Xyl93]
MLNPLDAADAVAAAAEPLQDLLDDCHHVASIELFSVVPAAGTASGLDRMRDLAQAVYAGSGHQAFVGPLVSPRAWRGVFRGAVTRGFMQPAVRYSDPDLRTPAGIRRAGEVADGIADLIEAHLGPVRCSGDVSDPRRGCVGRCNMLLVTDDRATILHLGIYD